MAQHVYMSVGKISKDKKLIDKSTGQENSAMRYRGETGKDDDVASFARKMEEKGHIVQVHDSIIGRPGPRGHMEYEYTGGL